MTTAAATYQFHAHASGTAYGFEWIDHGDGKRTLLDVPVFLRCERDGEEYDEGYIRAAFAKMRREEAIRGHMPPVNIGHRMLGRPEPEGAGYMRAVRMGEIDGRLAIFCDVTITNPRAIDLVWSERLPYRSAEVIRPSKGDPAIEELALLDTAPFLALPMTRPVASARNAAVSIDRSPKDAVPVVAFASFDDRVLMVLGARPMATSEETAGAATAETRRVRIPAVCAEIPSTATGADAPASTVATFSAEGGAAGESTAEGAIADLIAKIREKKIALGDVPKVVAGLRELLDEIEGGGAGASGHEPREEPANPSPNPMNMGADVTNPNPNPSTSPAGASIDVGAELARMRAEFDGKEAALSGKLASFAAEREQEKAVGSTLKRLASFSYGADPEAEIRAQIAKGGEHWQIALETFAATVEKTAPKARTPAGASRGGTTASGGDEWPEEVRKVATTPVEGEAALRALAMFRSTQQSGLLRDLDFGTYWKTNRAHFGAPVA